jgi:hypothetical protein
MMHGAFRVVSNSGKFPSAPGSGSPGQLSRNDSSDSRSGVARTGLRNGGDDVHAQDESVDRRDSDEDTHFGNPTAGALRAAKNAHRHDGANGRRDDANGQHNTSHHRSSHNGRDSGQSNSDSAAGGAKKHFVEHDRDDALWGKDGQTRMPPRGTTRERDCVCV